MKNTRLTNIGLNSTETTVIADKLNDLLSNYQLFYMNLRGFHWNITGRKFFELHIKFEELYNDAVLKIDEVAERILTLSQSPLHTYSKYLMRTEVKEVADVVDGEIAIDHILEALKILLRKERDILEIAAKTKDEGTVALMSNYIIEQEKLVWMLSAYKS